MPQEPKFNHIRWNILMIATILAIEGNYVRTHGAHPRRDGGI